MTNAAIWPARRLTSFSIRAMLLLIFLMAASLAWPLHKVRAQRIAVAELERMGCRIDGFSFLENRSPGMLQWTMNLLGEEDLEHICGVRAERSRLTDTGMAKLRVLSELTFLNLEGRKITDAGLANLKRLTELRLLDLDKTEISDAGLAHLVGLRKLDHLYLSETKVSDAGLVHLRNMARLETLMLDATSITDAGLIYLQVLPQLTYLYLARTRVTDTGVQKLQEALPQLLVYR